MTGYELREQIDRQASVWWALHAPIGELSQHAFCEAVKFIVIVSKADAELDRLTARVAELESELMLLCDVLGEDDLEIVHKLLD